MAQGQIQLLLAQAQQAKQSGDNNRARAILSQAIKAEPRNEEAWLLLAEVAEKKEHSIYCLEQVLKLNPVNMEAVERLNALKLLSAPAAPLPLTTLTATPISMPAAKKAPERETVIHKERIHWAMFINPIILALLGLLIMLPGILSQEARSLLCIGAPLVALALLALLRLVIIYFTHEFTLTNKRIVIRTGLLSRHTFEVLLMKVEAIGVSQSFFGRILGYGDILITGTGGAKQTFKGMQDPVAFRERIEAQVATVQQGN